MRDRDPASPTTAFRREGGSFRSDSAPEVDESRIVEEAEGTIIFAQRDVGSSVTDFSFPPTAISESQCNRFFFIRCNLFPRHPKKLKNI